MASLLRTDGLKASGLEGFSVFVVRLLLGFLGVIAFGCRALGLGPYG